MEDGNTQQYLNILPPRTKNQIKLILNFSTKKKKNEMLLLLPLRISLANLCSQDFFLNYHWCIK